MKQHGRLQDIVQSWGSGSFMKPAWSASRHGTVMGIWIVYEASMVGFKTWYSHGEWIVSSQHVYGLGSQHGRLQDMVQSWGSG